MRRVKKDFRKKQCFVISTCMLIFVFSQTGFAISTNLLTNENSLEVKKIVHLTTAIFLLILGSLLEFSNFSNLFIFLVNLFTFVAKMQNAYILQV